MKKNAHPENAFQQLVADLEPRYGLGEARSIVRIVFEDGFGLALGERKPEEFVFSENEETRFLEIRQRLLAGEPVQYVLGTAQFLGLNFKVSPTVLIPRQETEELAVLAFQILKKYNLGQPKILDIGTGSGCIPIYLKKKLPNLEVFACDVCSSALDVALENAVDHETEIDFRLADILNENDWDGFPELDLVVSNPPYIPRREADLVPDFVKNHEPHLALFVEDEDALVFYKAISRFGLKKLRRGGFLLFECNEFNAEEVFELLKSSGYEEVMLQNDISGAPRIVFGKR